MLLNNFKMQKDIHREFCENTTINVVFCIYKIPSESYENIARLT